MSEHRSIPQQHCTMKQPLCFSEADFHETLVQFFRSFVSTRPMDWTCIQKSVSHFAPFFKFNEFAALYFDYVFGLFEDFRITNRAVIASCVKEYCRYKMYNFGFLISDVDNSFHYPMDKRQADVVPEYEYVMEPVPIEELLFRSFLYKDIKAVMRILRYINPSYMKSKDLKYNQAHVLIKIWEDPIFSEYISDYYCYQWSDEGARRLKLTLMVIEFVLQVWRENCQNVIKGLKLLFQALPDPYITWQEISRFLTRRLTFSPSESQILCLKSFQEICTECIPECQQRLEPRSLKHLARCTVRRCLSDANTLPHGVWRLGLPRELEDYVLLQRQKDQFRPVIPPLSRERMFVLRPVPEIQSQETMEIG